MAFWNTFSAMNNKLEGPAPAFMTNGDDQVGGGRTHCAAVACMLPLRTGLRRGLLVQLPPPRRSMLPLPDSCMLFSVLCSHPQQVNVFLSGNTFPVPSSAAAPSSGSGGGGLSTGAIVGIVVGCVLGVVAVAAAGGWYIARRRRRGAETQASGKFNRFLDDAFAEGQAGQSAYQPPSVPTFYETAPVPSAYAPPAAGASRGVELSSAAAPAAQV